MENKNTNSLHISWKKKIKDLQILFFILIGCAYYIYGYVQQTYSSYLIKKQEYSKIEKKIENKKKELTLIENKTKILQKIYTNKDSFIKSYNNCYRKYSLQKYGVRPIGGPIKSLSDCMVKNVPELNGFSDEDIIKIAIGFGVRKSNMPKFNVDHKVLLASLDKNIFNNNLESETDFLTLSNPSLLDKKLNLYKSNFSISVEKDFKGFMDLLQKLQISLYDKNNIYYNITSLSDFDISNLNEKQKISIQGTFYFTK